MNEEKTRMIFMIIASLLAFIWIILLFVRKKKYMEIIKGVRRKGKKHFFADLLMVGINIIDLLKLKGSSERSIKLKKVLADNYGDKYTDFYYLILRARQFTIGFSALPIVFIVVSVQTISCFFLIVIIIVGLLIYDLEREERIIHDERKEAMITEFPRVISKLTLLISAGMPLREGWRRVSLSGDGLLYKEMQATMDEMSNGVMEVQAYKNFGSRCDVKEIQKFSSMLIQNMQKGSRELSGYMRDLASDMWNIRKDIAKKKGDKAASLLLVPTTLIFIGILIMVIAPAMAQMSL